MLLKKIHNLNNFSSLEALQFNFPGIFY